MIKWFKRLWETLTCKHDFQVCWTGDHMHSKTKTLLAIYTVFLCVKCGKVKFSKESKSVKPENSEGVSSAKT